MQEKRGPMRIVGCKQRDSNYSECQKDKPGAQLGVRSVEERSVRVTAGVVLASIRGRGKSGEALRVVPTLDGWNERKGNDEMNVPSFSEYAALKQKNLNPAVLINFLLWTCSLLTALTW